jgi:hypothetical protein
MNLSVFQLESAEGLDWEGGTGRYSMLSDANLVANPDSLLGTSAAGAIVHRTRISAAMMPVDSAIDLGSGALSTAGPLSAASLVVPGASTLESVDVGAGGLSLTGPLVCGGTLSFNTVLDTSGIPSVHLLLTQTDTIFASKPVTINPNFTAVGKSKIKGTVDGTAVSVGDIGEVLSAIESGEAHVTTGITQAILSISLAPGRWRVDGNFSCVGSSDNLQAAQATVNDTSGFSGFVEQQTRYASASLFSSFGGVCPPFYISTAATTLVYLNVTAGYASGSCMDSGMLFAHRIA